MAGSFGSRGSVRLCFRRERRIVRGIFHRCKALALLAYLAVTRASHPREALATLLWPEWDASSARADLRRTLSLVNDALGGSAIVADRETAGLDPDLTLWVDVAELQAKLSVCASHGHAVGEACGACVGALEEAVTLYRGDFLAGFTLEDSAGFDEWQFFETQALRDVVTGALARLVTWHVAQGEHSTERAIDYARRWLALDPLQEGAHRQLMALYTKVGQRSAALRQYRQCVRTLEEELGVTPSAETMALYERIRTERQVPRAAGLAPESETQGPRLPSFLEMDEGSDAPEPLFVTREEELARLEGYLTAALGGAGQVAFVTGGAGRGKTALLRDFVRRAMAAHPALLVTVSGLGNTSLRRLWTWARQETNPMGRPQSGWSLASLVGWRRLVAIPRPSRLGSRISKRLIRPWSAASAPGAWSLHKRGAWLG